MLMKHPKSKEPVNVHDSQIENMRHIGYVEYKPTQQPQPKSTEKQEQK